MRLKKINPDKELKKIQKKGIHNKNIKILGIVISAILIVFIVPSFALFTSERITAAFTSKVNKKIKINLIAENGTINGSNVQQINYNENQSISIMPVTNYIFESLTCTNNQNATYDENNNLFNITALKDTTCTIKFKEVPLLKEAIMASNTLNTANPNFGRGEPPVSGTNTGSGFYKAEDDDGDTYYFRGDVQNNYVKFAKYQWDRYYDKNIHTTLTNGKNVGDPIIWRIMRINGDGSIRLVMNDHMFTSAFGISNNEQKYVGYTYDNGKLCTVSNPCDSSTGTSSLLKTTLEDLYEKNFKEYDDKIVASGFCNDTYHSSTAEYYSYDAVDRLNMGTPSLKCQDTNETYGGYYKLKIGLLSADEANYAGMAYESTIKNNYLSYQNSVHTLTPNNGFWLTMFDTSIGSSGTISDSYQDDKIVINLKEDIRFIDGDGTQDNPYVIY